MNNDQKIGRPGLLMAIEQGLKTMGANRGALIVVLPFFIDTGLIQTVLQLPDVAGLMLPASVVIADDRLAGLVGSIPDAGDWTLPSVSAQGLLLLDDPACLAVAWWRSALRAGLHRCVFMTTEGRWCVRSLRAEFMRQLVRRVRQRGRQYFAGSREMWFERRLSRCWAHCVRAAPSPRRGSVMHVSASLGAGGAERQLVRVGNAQVGAGISVSLLITGAWLAGDAFFRRELRPEVRLDCLGFLPELFAGLEDDGRIAWRLHCADGSEQLLALLPAPFADKVRRFRAEFLIARPAVVHLWQDETNVAGGLGALLAGVPRIVLAQRNLAPWRFAYYSDLLRPLYRFLACQDGVVMLNNTQAGAADYAEWLGLPPGRILTIANAVDAKLEFPAPEALAAWRAQHDLASRPVVGGMFRLMDEKDPLLWLSTVALLARQQPTVRFLLVGDGPRRELVADEIRRLELDRRICWLPAEKDVSLPLAAMDVFLLTSRAEGMPNVLMEAGLLGCPVVTTDVGGCAEVVEQGVNGWLVSERRAEVLAEKVLAVLGDAPGRERIRREAPSLIRSKFSMERVLAQTLAVYDPDGQALPGAGDGSINRRESS